MRWLFSHYADGRVIIGYQQVLLWPTVASAVTATPRGVDALTCLRIKIKARQHLFLSRLPVLFTQVEDILNNVKHYLIVISASAYTLGQLLLLRFLQIPPHSLYSALF